MVTSVPTVSSSVTSLATVQLERRVLGPTTQPSPTEVLPQSMVMGRSSVSLPTVTSGPTQTVLGSSMVTPEARRPALILACASAESSASWMREFTPRPSR